MITGPAPIGLNGMNSIATCPMTEKDTSWERALEAVRATLRVPSALSTLIRGSWAGLLSPKDFMRLVGFPGCNSAALLHGAHIRPSKEPPDAEEIEAAVTQLGVKSAAVMLSINFICQSVLESSPPEKLWTVVLKDMMSEVEIGYHFGMSSDSLGCEHGMLVAFSRWAGLAVLLGRSHRDFSDCLDAGDPGRSHTIKAFGCEAYQAGSLALQQLGFGPDIATAAAISVGDLQAGLVDLKPEVATWRAARRWIAALKDGEPYPQDKAAQQAFSELIPPVMCELGREPAPLHLAMLLDSVAKVRSEQSCWTWHLPRPSYEESAREVAKYRSHRMQSKSRTLTAVSR